MNKNISKLKKRGLVMDKEEIFAKTAIFALISMILFTASSVSTRVAEDFIVRREFIVSEMKLRYAQNMFFDFQVFVCTQTTIERGFYDIPDDAGERHLRTRYWWARDVADPISPRFDPFYDQIVFVHSEEEAVCFPENFIVAWPSQNGTHNVLARFNETASRTERELLTATGRLRRPVIVFEDFGLSYPITVYDLVENWSSVNRVWNTLYHEERRRINSSGTRTSLMFHTEGEHDVSLFCNE